MSTNVTWHGGAVGADDRPYRGATVWLTGLSGSGKSTVAVELERLLVAAGRPGATPAPLRTPAANVDGPLRQSATSATRCARAETSKSRTS